MNLVIIGSGNGLSSVLRIFGIMVTLSLTKMNFKRRLHNVRAVFRPHNIQPSSGNIYMILKATNRLWIRTICGTPISILKVWMLNKYSRCTLMSIKTWNKGLNNYCDFAPYKCVRQVVCMTHTKRNGQYTFLGLDIGGWGSLVLVSKQGKRDLAVLSGNCSFLKRRNRVSL